MINILLTGATGFLGSHLLKSFLQKGYNCIILKRTTSNIERIKELIDKIKIFNVDGSSFSYSKLFEENKIDIIVHTATQYGRENHSIPELLKTNLIFPLTLLEQGIKNNVSLFINTDSYFNKPNHSYNTLLDYSLSKKSLNMWLDYLSRNIKIINLRLEHIYGDNDNNDKFVQMMINQIAFEQKKEVKLTYGQQKRDFIFVDDVCAAYITVIEKYQQYYFNYLEFDVGTGKAITIAEFVSLIKNLSNSKSELKFGSIPYREDEIMISKADINGLLNWGWGNRFITPKEGICKILERKNNI